MEIEKCKFSNVLFIKTPANFHPTDIIFAKDEKTVLFYQDYYLHIFRMDFWEKNEPEYLNLKIGDHVYELVQKGRTYFLKNNEDHDHISEGVVN